MFQYINRRNILVVVAIFIMGASLWYTNSLAEKLAAEEKSKVQHLANAIRTVYVSENTQETEFAFKTIEENRTIPLIITDDKGGVVDSRNLDSSKSLINKNVIADKLNEFKKLHAPIIADWGSGRNYIYYGETYLLTQLRYFPYVQLTIIALFLMVVIIALSASYRSLQNQVWVGLSKETAHQLGTPLSSIEGWLEILRDEVPGNDAVIEMQKDLDRLKLVADRFSKVGSEPQLHEENLIVRLEDMVNYMQKRAPLKVKISLHAPPTEVMANISGALFDWVIENLIRNALDAMEGKGAIDIFVERSADHQIHIDVQDNGKGISKAQIKKIFNPGFTTKKRGWGLGLTLSRRIIEKYHKGSIFVKSSEVGTGTTFRIILRS